MAEYIDRRSMLERLRVTPLLMHGIPPEVRAGVIDLVERHATADVAPVRHGEWMPYHEVDFGWNKYGYACTLCNYRVEYEDFTLSQNYCPRCGAKMDGGVDT